VNLKRNGYPYNVQLGRAGRIVPYAVLAGFLVNGTGRSILYTVLAGFPVNGTDRSILYTVLTGPSFTLLANSCL
jgi:hypothetical protein